MMSPHTPHTPQWRLSPIGKSKGWILLVVFAFIGFKKVMVVAAVMMVVVTFVVGVVEVALLVVE